MAIWQDLVDRYGFPARYASVRRFVVNAARPALRRKPTSVITTEAWRRGPGGLRRRPDGSAPESGQVPAHAALRAHARPFPFRTGQMWSFATTPNSQLVRVYLTVALPNADVGELRRRTQEAGNAFSSILQTMRFAVPAK